MVIVRDVAFIGDGEWLVRTLTWETSRESVTAEDTRSLAVLTIATIGRAAQKQPARDAESSPNVPAEIAKYTVENTTNNGEFDT